MHSPNSPQSYLRRRPAGALLVALVLSLAAACGGSDTGSTDPNLTKVKVALDWTTYVGYHSALVEADEKGHFADEGLEVDFDLTAGSKDGVLAVGTKRADIGWVDLSTAAVSMLAGVPVKAVATVQEKNATGLTALKGTDLDSPADVKGMRIGSTPGGSDSTLVPAFLAANGLKKSDITLVNLPANGKLASLIAGDVDAISGQVYYYKSALKSQGKDPHGMLYSDAGLDVLDHGFIASDAFIKDNAKIIPQFLSAYRKGLSDTIADPEAACKSTADRSEGAMTTEGCVAELDEWLKLVYSPDSPTWGQSSAESFESTVAILKKFGGATGDKKPTDMFTNDHLPASN